MFFLTLISSALGILMASSVSTASQPQGVPAGGYNLGAVASFSEVSSNPPFRVRQAWDQFYVTGDDDIERKIKTFINFSPCFIRTIVDFFPFLEGYTLCEKFFYGTSVDVLCNGTIVVAIYIKLMNEQPVHVQGNIAQPPSIDDCASYYAALEVPMLMDPEEKTKWLEIQISTRISARRVRYAFACMISMLPVECYYKDGKPLYTMKNLAGIGSNIFSGLMSLQFVHTL